MKPTAEELLAELRRRREYEKATRYDDDGAPRFVQVWNLNDSAAETGAQLGITAEAARQRAAYWRRQKFFLKPYRPGRPRKK